jgi:hypothetical protein
MWGWFNGIIAAGEIAVTEIYEEMLHIEGLVGDQIKACRDEMVLEINKPGWDWERYLIEFAGLEERHREYISEYSGGSPKTICLKDLSIIALAKTLELPVVSMEAITARLPHPDRHIRV